MKYFIAIYFAVIALRCYGSNYYGRSNPSYMSRTSSQEQEDRLNEDDYVNYQAKQKNSNYPNTQNRNYVNRYNQYNQTSNLNEVRQRRAKYRNNFTTFYGDNSGQRQIYQVSDNKSLSRNNRRSQIRQINSNSIEDVSNKYDSYENGRRDSMSNGNFVGRNNTSVRNSGNRRTKNI
uniref:GATA zinc finger domain-containing protein 14-like n=1 Tax=Strongyloides venezuelensis TaxID=75913 RepID=A0A0K0FQE5_STRVS